MTQNGILIDINNYLKNNYPHLFILYKGEFIGCKYEQSDKYFIFYISNYLGEDTLSYRININSGTLERKSIEGLSLEEIKTQIDLVLNNIELNKSFKVKKILKKEISNIENLEKEFDRENILKKFGNIPLNKVDMSYRLYNICLKHNIKSVADFLLMPIGKFYNFKNLGRQTFKEVIMKKTDILNANVLLNIPLDGNQETLNDIYYHPNQMDLKLEFTEDEYDRYIDFGIEIGTITIDSLQEILTKKQLDIFKMRMNIVASNKSTLEYIGNYFNVSRERIRQILNKTLYKIRNVDYELRNKYINLFNTIKDKDILNYLLIGIENIYNTFFLEFVLSMMDDNIVKPLIDRINTLYEQARKESNNQFVKYHVEENLYNLIKFPTKINFKAKEIFDSLHKERDTFDFNNNGTQKLSKFDKEVAYESKLEKEIIKSYSKCTFVTNIKTQSLVINYKYKGKICQYYPDIQILINNELLAIIEVKPAYHMVDSLNMAKYKALKNYCEQNGFGYAMIDDHLNSMEKLKKLHVEKNIYDDFIDYVKENSQINYCQFKNFKTLYNIKTIELEKVILDNPKILECKISPSFKITYINK